MIAHMVSAISENFAIALLGAGVTLVVSLVALFGQLASIKASVKTNHGKRPGEYLEMIAELLEGQGEIKAQLDAHTTQDAERFDELTERLDELTGP